MWSRVNLGLKYAILAAIATAANVGSQDLAVRAYTGADNILFSVLVGTAAGLLVKYILDKRYIFGFRARGIAHDGWVFALYSFMGLLTTMIFWAFEFGFQFFFQTRELRYIGATIGLAIGYLAKYHLDRRFVFREGAA